MNRWCVERGDVCPVPLNRSVIDGRAGNGFVLFPNTLSDGVAVVAAAAAGWC